MSRDAIAATKPHPAHLKPVEPGAPETKTAEAPGAAPAAGPAVASDAAKAKPNRRKLVLIGSVAVIALAAVGWYGTKYLVSGRYMVSTEDAYVRAHNTTLASKIAGYVASVPVDDNAQVRAGDIIATIDDGDYRLAVEAARRKVATQEATVDRFARQVVAQDANIAQARAQLVSADANAKKTQSEFERQQSLSSRQFASKQAFEQAEAGRDQATASVQSAQAAVDSAVATLDVVKAQHQEAAGTLAELKTALAKAERDLSFTVIRAPVDGVVGNRAVQVGDYVQTGQRFAQSGAARSHLRRRQLQGDAARAAEARPERIDQRRCAARARHPGPRRIAVAGFRRGVLAAAARQRHRQLHQDRAAHAGARRSPGRRRHAASAAAGHVGRGQRQHQARD